MRRVLCITPFSPLPPTEGHRKRILSTILMLKRMGFTVDLLLLSRDYHWHRTAGEFQFAALRELTDSFHIVPGDYLVRDDNSDWGLDDWMSPSFEAYVKWLSGRRNYDVVFCNYVFLTQTLTFFPKSVCRILDTHDRFGGRRQMLLENGSRLEFFYTSERDEAIGLERSDLVIAIKKQEEQYFRRIAGKPVAVLPYVEQQNLASNLHRANKPRKRVRKNPVRRSKVSHPVFGYFASSNWINRENFYQFVECYKNSQRFRNGERVKLEIYGSLCNIIEQNNDAYISRGPVKEVAEAYDNIDCVVIPQEFSTGLKIKVSEALSFGRPIIAHHHALEGFPIQNDALMSCQSFEELVERCFAVQAQPLLLDTLCKESIIVQESLLKETAAAELDLSQFIEERLPTICIVADSNALLTDPIYFEFLQCAASAISGVARVSLCAYGSLQASIHDYENKGGSHINEFWTANAPSELETWINGKSAWQMLILTPDAQLVERINNDGFSQPSQILYFVDICAYTALSSAPGTVIPPSNCVYVIGRTKNPVEIPIWHFRWLPWSLSFSGALAHHVVSKRGFLFTRSRATSKTLLEESLDIVSLEPLDMGAMTVPELVRMLLITRIKPRFVVDETGFAPQYRLILEILHLNGIPIFSTSEDDRDFLYAGGMADWRISSIFTRPPDIAAIRHAPDWDHSGWGVLRKRISSLGEKFTTKNLGDRATNKR